MRNRGVFAGQMGVLALAIACAMPARALDVDRIDVQSRLGEPLLAEIPVIDASAADLRSLRAQLASAATFARIGLERPSGVLSDLRFEVVNRGRQPVIRIRSTMPVEAPFLTFLLQVEWAQGRLVREYALALHTQDSLPALAPAVDAPQQAPDSVITSAAPVADDSARVEPKQVTTGPIGIDDPGVAEGAAGLAPSQAQPRISPAGTPDQAARRAGSEPVAPIPLRGDRPGATSAPRQEPSRAAAAEPTFPQAPSRAVPAAPPPAPGEGASYPVRRGDNLTGVVKRMGLAHAGLPQAMLALLRTNPQAFAHGNINLLQHGAVLRPPSVQELTRLDAAAAEALVRRQIEQWRSGDMPPAALQDALPPMPMPAAGMDGAAAAGSVAASSSARPASPRLEIAPATAATSGSAGGGASGGTATNAAVAAADATANRYTRIQEMRARIAELEARERAQQQLLQMKDDALARAPVAAPSAAWAWLVATLAIVVAALALLRRPRSNRRPALQGASSPVPIAAITRPQGS